MITEDDARMTLELDDRYVDLPAVDAVQNRPSGAVRRQTGRRGLSLFVRRQQRMARRRHADRLDLCQSGMTAIIRTRILLVWRYRVASRSARSGGTGARSRGVLGAARKGAAYTVDLADAAEPAR